MANWCLGDYQMSICNEILHQSNFNFENRDLTKIKNAAFHELNHKNAALRYLQFLKPIFLIGRTQVYFP